MANPIKVDMIKLRAAIESSWEVNTAYMQEFDADNPARNQCYPTSRVVQEYFPNTKIVKGVVYTGKEKVKHFWNVLNIEDVLYHIDLSWQQFPHGSVVESFRILKQNELDTEKQAVDRVELLLKKVQSVLVE